MRYGSASATSVQTTGRTGGTCEVSGPYKCYTHTNVVIVLKSGQKFPACPNANTTSGHGTTWVLMRA
jgi:hypothetical protein